jgi:hypothetical protein
MIPIIGKRYKIHYVGGYNGFGEYTGEYDEDDGDVVYLFRLDDPPDGFGGWFSGIDIMGEIDEQGNIT